MPRTVFISYAHEDDAHARAIAHKLDQLGIDYWLDNEQLHAGAHLLDSIQDGIAESFCFVVLHSEHSYRSSYVRNELQFALDHQIPIIPIHLDDQEYTQWWGHRIGRLTYAYRPNEVDDQMELLVTGIQAHYRRTAPVIAFTNFKGGVGKTTLAAHLSGIFASEFNKRVLLIDLDPQHNLSQFFYGSDMLDAFARLRRSSMCLFEPGLHEVGGASEVSWSTFDYSRTTPVSRSEIRQQLVTGADGQGSLDIIPGQFDLAKYCLMTRDGARTAASRNFFTSLQSFRSYYDYIVMDTNPSVSLISELALDHSDMLVSPLHPDRYGLRGVRLLRRVLHERQRNRPAPLKRATVVNRVDNHNPQMQRFFQSLISGDFDQAIEALPAGVAPRDPESHYVAPTYVQESNFMLVPVLGDSETGVDRLISFNNNQVANPIRESLFLVADDIKRRLEQDHETNNWPHLGDAA